MTGNVRNARESLAHVKMSPNLLPAQLHTEAATGPRSVPNPEVVKLSRLTELRTFQPVIPTAALNQRQSDVRPNTPTRHSAAYELIKRASDLFGGLSLILVPAPIILASAVRYRLGGLPARHPLARTLPEFTIWRLQILEQH